MTIMKTFMKAYGEEIRSMSNPSSNDMALYALLQEFKSRVAELMQVDFDNNAMGEMFHKNFRQIEPTDIAGVDSAIWYLMRSAKVYWAILDKVYTVEYINDKPKG